MNLIGIILVLLSACCHATWNLLSKHDGDPISFSAFRQLSIIITAVISMTYLERDFSWPRLAGVIVIFGGVVMIGFA